MDESVIALLPMKGHSERISNKNIRSFAETPLFFKILQALEKSKSVKSIYIDTDSKEIANLAQVNFDVNIIWRPDSLLGDYVSMNRIIEYDIARIDYEHFIQTHATNPLLRAETIDKAVEIYFRDISRHDSLFSVTRLQARLYDKDLKPINHDPKELIRTQDLPPVYEENSNFYIFSREGFSKSGQRIGMKPGIYELDKLEALDIDEESDFILAEKIYQMRNFV